MIGGPGIDLVKFLIDLPNFYYCEYLFSIYNGRAMSGNIRFNVIDINNIFNNDNNYCSIPRCLVSLELAGKLLSRPELEERQQQRGRNNRDHRSDNHGQAGQSALNRSEFEGFGRSGTMCPYAKEQAFGYTAANGQVSYDERADDHPGNSGQDDKYGSDRRDSSKPLRDGHRNRGRDRAGQQAVHPFRLEMHPSGQQSRGEYGDQGTE